MEITNDLLQAYLYNFYGYGNLESNIWFIGKEEAGGKDKKDIDARLEAWFNSGKPLTVDLYDYHKKVFDIKNIASSDSEMAKLFDKNAKGYKLQKTWAGLIKLQLATEGRYDGKQLSSVKAYQNQHLGRSGSENCLLELFPIASPSTSKFAISKFFSLNLLENRSTYKKELSDHRIERIKQLIESYRPRVVVFYSTDAEYKKYWYRIANIDFEKKKIFKYKKKTVRALSNNGTLFLITPHPTAFGIPNKLWVETGKYIQEAIEGNR